MDPPGWSARLMAPAYGEAARAAAGYTTRRRISSVRRAIHCSEKMRWKVPSVLNTSSTLLVELLTLPVRMLDLLWMYVQVM